MRFSGWMIPALAALLGCYGGELRAAAVFAVAALYTAR